MSLPRYPRYKESGVAWLGCTPVHWEVCALDRLVNRIESGVSVNAVDEPAENGAIGVLKTSCVYRGQFNPGENKAVVPEEIDRVACPVQAGALIVSRMNTPALVGAAGLVERSYRTLFLPDRLWQVHFGGTSAKFIHYWAQSQPYRSQVQMACAGTSASMQNLSQREFLGFALAVPPKSEQTAVTRFLDYEAAKIDALIAEQERLIALLAEKRQATISHAVTRGLDPDAPTKDSGVAWLGEVPAHWEAGCLKRFAQVIDCKHYTVEFLDEGLPIASIRELRENRIDLTNAKLTSRREWDFLREDRSPAPGDLVFCRNASVGAIGYVAADTPSFCMGQDVCLIRPSTRSKFMYYQLLAAGTANQIEALLVGATIRRVNVEEIRRLVVACPPAYEQRDIADFVDIEIAKLDALQVEATRAITLLKERRSALITAAVTGQIDVRGTAPVPESAKADTAVAA